VNGTPGPDGASRREGRRLLDARVRSLPGELQRTFADLPGQVDGDVSGGAGLRRVVATGAGSSAAHARFLASVLAERGLAARAEPLGSFLGAPPGGCADDVLVVFSQGLSPNARIPLAHPAAWRRVWLVTATPDADDPGPAGADDAAAADAAAAATGSPATARRSALRAARESGVRILRTPGADEYGTLLRLVGPMVGHAAALVLADALAPVASIPGATPACRADLVAAACAAVAGATERLRSAIADLDPEVLDAPLALLASGAHVERASNLPLKFLEGLLRPLPPAWDLLDFAHGPFQQLHDGPALLLALARTDVPVERLLLDRLGTMLVPGRHRLVELASSLPGAWAVFEHEALVDAFVLDEIERRGIDPMRWPGRGADAPLYGFDGSDVAGERVASPPATQVARMAAPSRPRAARSLEALAWPDLADRLSAGGVTAVLPLGSTEQHGPHLPFGTDTRIAAELARRLCMRLPEAVALPTLALGCAGEHMSFPGTLDLREDTLVSVLRDVAVSLGRHGLARLFVFSAHGGNRAALDRALPVLREAAPRLVIARGPGAESLGPLFTSESARHGVSTAACGQHAGEFETSILLHLSPVDVRTDRLAPGLLLDAPGAPDPFHPDLRVNAADGTVGDPRGAAASRAEGYLDAWVEELLVAYRNPAIWNQAKGRKNA
jgi:creatinine amidohydrolase